MDRKLIKSNPFKCFISTYKNNKKQPLENKQLCEYSISVRIKIVHLFSSKEKPPLKENYFETKQNSNTLLKQKQKISSLF